MRKKAKYKGGFIEDLPVTPEVKDLRYLANVCGVLKEE